MIKHYEHKKPRFLVTGAILTVITLGIILRPVRAADATSDDPKAVANGAMVTWLKEMDDGQYEQSWQDAAPDFQAAVTAQSWETVSKKVRTPLGKCTGRVLASASHQTDLPSPKGSTKGDYILAQFDTSFEGLKYAVETVTFSRTPDGGWKASGYYVKPK